MKRGRKPKPSEQKRLSGNPGKRKLVDGPRPSSSLPFAPNDLSPSELIIWQERAAALSPVGMLTDADRAFLKRSCQVSAFTDADHGALLVLGDPKALADDKLELWFKLRREFRQTSNLERLQLAELGMTPSARSRAIGKAIEDPTWEEDRAAMSPLRVISGGKK